MQSFSSVFNAMRMIFRVILEQSRHSWSFEDCAFFLKVVGSCLLYWMPICRVCFLNIPANLPGGKFASAAPLGIIERYKQNSTWKSGRTLKRQNVSEYPPSFIRAFDVCFCSDHRTDGRCEKAESYHTDSDRGVWLRRKRFALMFKHCPFL